MTQNPNDSLLLSGKMIARLLQGVCAFAGTVVLLLIPIVLLLSQDMLPGFGKIESDIIEASPLSVITILAMLALIIAALFSFFGKLRMIIVSAGEGDPFTPENASRLNAMAWLFLGVKVMALAVGGLRLYLANLVINDANGGDALNFSLYDLDALVIIIVLFILARIFRHGTAMRDDLNGTV
jgi:succinate dehydrogenase/fumarate reductase cytochrome b subunit